MTNLTIGVEYPSQNVDGIEISRTEHRCLHLSSKLDSSQFQKVLRDHQVLGDIINQHYSEMMGIVEDVLSGRIQSARSKAESIGLTEEVFRGAGGGLLWLVAVAVAAAILLYSSDAQ